MSLSDDLFDALSPLTATVPTTPTTKACYEDAYPQNKGQPDPWPAIRYTVISAVPDGTICGSGGEEETDFRIQVDCLEKTADLRNTLRLAIQAAMAVFPIPLLVDSWSTSYDTQVKGYTARIDFVLQPSST